VLYAWRSFEAYPIFVALNGALSVKVPLLNYTHDLDEMANRVTGETRLIFICNPNNPTGTAVRRQALQRFLQRVPDHVMVVLDEAYREFVIDETVPDGLTFLDGHPNLVVLRTFSKAYGLAGLRVGYAITSDPAVAAALRKTQIPFAVTTVAQAAALASLEPSAQGELMRRVNVVVGERTRVRDALRSIGYEVPESHSNFVWLPLGEAAVSWADACEKHGVIVRAFAGDGVRVTISTPADNDRLLDAAARSTAFLG
jgi:histidinol-phosphate aminotransferase